MRTKRPSVDEPCCTCSRPLLALFPRSLRCADSVRFLRNFCRADEATAMPLDDAVAPSPMQARCDAASRCGVRGELVVSGYFVCSDKVTE